MDFYYHTYNTSYNIMDNFLKNERNIIRWRGNNNFHFYR